MSIPDKFWKVAIGALGILFIFLAVLSIKSLKEIGYVGTNPQNPNTITVDGTGDAVAVPDVATFSFTVTETDKTVVAAQTAATSKLNDALKAVRDQGVADKDISTESYNINPHYEYQNSPCAVGIYNTSAGVSAGSATGGTMVPVTPPSSIYCPPGKSVLTGYDVSETIQVKIHDLSKAGTIFTSIGSLGVENVNGLSFSVDDPNAVQAQARTKAIADAKTKATELAGELGVQLVRVVGFSENNNYPRPIMYAMAASAGGNAKEAAVPLEVPTGEQKVTDNVTITYEIQ